MNRAGPVLFRTLALAGLFTMARAAAAAEDDSPRRVRTSAEIFTFLALDYTLLHLSGPPAADPPGNVSLVDKLTFKAWSFDASSFPTNFAAHPLAGTFYYTTARSNRSSPLESLGWASLASLTWELAEFPENVSLNDLVVTPVAGASIGESLVQMSRWLDRGPQSLSRRVLSGLLFPMKLLNGGPPVGKGDAGALAADLRVVAGVGAHSGPELGIGIAT